jgi:hypothetical protein
MVWECVVGFGRRAILYGYASRCKESVGGLYLSEKVVIIGVRSTETEMIDFVIHHLDSWAMFASINRRRIVFERLGCMDMMVSANIVLGPHSFECG